MRTTLDIDDAVMRAAKQRAAGQGKTLTRFVEEALREALAAKPAGKKRFKLKLRILDSAALPGVDFADRDSLYEIMEGRK